MAPGQRGLSRSGTVNANDCEEAVHRPSTSGFPPDNVANFFGVLRINPLITFADSGPNLTRC